MTLNRDFQNVIITGVGGQGNVLASQILAQMMLNQGFKVTIGETLGVSQRGGSVMSHLRISRERRLSPQIPEGKAHLVLTLEPVEGLRVLGTYGNPETRMVANTKPVYPIGVLAGEAEYPPVETITQKIKELTAGLWTLDATRIGTEMGAPILANIALLGAAVGLDLIQGDREVFEKVIQEIMPQAKAAANLEAFDRGAGEVEAA